MPFARIIVFYQSRSNKLELTRDRMRFLCARSFRIKSIDLTRLKRLHTALLRIHITHTFFKINKVSALLLLGCDGLNFRILTNCKI